MGKVPPMRVVGMIRRAAERKKRKKTDVEYPPPTR